MREVGDRLSGLFLLSLFQANFNVIMTYGAMAAFDGDIPQFLELTAWGHLLAFHVVQKLLSTGCYPIHKARE
jgi:hypothetical protein